MELVIDASAVLACVLGEPGREALLQAMDGRELVSPASLPFEIGNALSAGFKRGRLSRDQATAAIELYLRLPIELRPIDLAAAVRVAHQAHVYAYDAYMLQCALDSGGESLTLDKGLKSAPHPLRVSVLEIVT